MTSSILSYNFRCPNGAYALVEQYRIKVRSVYDLWVDMREGEDVTLNDLRNVYGAEAYAFNDIILD